MALVLPAAHAYPALQFPLHADVVTPLTEPYVPPGQTPLHTDDVRPAVDPYSPALQFVHTPDPATLYFPEGHTPCVGLVDPAGHAYPALQLPLQPAAVKADTAPYSPAAHTLQTPAPPKLY